MKSITVYLFGISNCDTIKKARAFLENNNTPYEFVDFRKDGLNQIQLRSWVEDLGWEKVINKRSTTWRSLPDETKENMNETLAIAVAEDQPTIIKRPILMMNNHIEVGFDPDKYARLFNIVL